MAKVDIKGSVPKVVAETGLGTIVDTPRRAYEFFKRDKEVSVTRVTVGGILLGRCLVRSSREKNLVL